MCLSINTVRCNKLMKYSLIFSLQDQTVPIIFSNGKKFIEPFQRLKFRTNLFRRKTSSSQFDLTSNKIERRSSVELNEIIPTKTINSTRKRFVDNVQLLKRSNSMICPQEHFESFAKNQRNSLNLNLIGRSSSRFCQRNLKSTMSSIDENSENSNRKNFRQSASSSIDEPFYDCAAQDEYRTKSISTMTGQSLENLSKIFSSAEKSVQTNSELSRLSNSSTSSSIDSLETRSDYSDRKSNCIFWVNYLGSAAIRIEDENPILMATDVMKRFKKTAEASTVLPIVGLKISPRGVEFLRQTKDRPVICFHPIEIIHCACQHQDLRYFAYVTREKRLVHSHPSNQDGQFFLHSANSIKQDVHHYCNVFVVRNEQMSTEVSSKSILVRFPLRRHLFSRIN